MQCVRHKYLTTIQHDECHQGDKTEYSKNGKKDQLPALEK